MSFNVFTATAATLVLASSIAFADNHGEKKADHGTTAPAATATTATDAAATTEAAPAKKAKKAAKKKVSKKRK